MFSRSITPIIRWLLFALATSPAFGALLFIHQYGVNLHYFDEWAPDLAGIFFKAHNYQVTLADLFSQHNEHRIVVPRLLLILVNPLTHWNAIAGLVMEWGVIAITSLLVLYLIRKTSDEVRGSPTEENPSFPLRVIVLWFMSNLLIFTPAQYQNLMWGMGFINVMPTIFVVLGIVTAASQLSEWTRLTICLALATAATYSSGNGILAWPLIGALLAWSIRRSGSRFFSPMAIIWITGCLINVVAYFHGYTKPPHGGAPLSSTKPTNILVFALTFLGGPFAHSLPWPPTSVGMACGSLMAAMYFSATVYFFYYRSKNGAELGERMLPWLLIGGYAIFSAAIAGRFRAENGLEESIASRYSTYAIYLPVALVNLVPMIAIDQRRRVHGEAKDIWTQLPGFFRIILIVLYSLSLSPAITAAQSMQLVSRQAKGAFLLAGIFPDNPSLVEPASGYPAAETLQEALDLDSIGYLQPPLLKSKDAEQIRASQLDHASSLTGDFDVFTGDVTHRPIAMGWAINSKTMQVVDEVFLTYDGPSGQSLIFAVAQMYVNRSDISRKMANPAYEWSGWVVPLSIDQLPANRNSFLITAWALDSDTGKAVPLKGQLQLKR